MKKLLLILMFSYSLTSISQTNFEWNVTDSTSKTKNQIYSDTKVHIATYWKSAQSVIQNDDKDGGIIIIKGSQKEEFKEFFTIYTYVYDYMVTFKMKDNKFKITLNNVFCSNAYCSARAAPQIDKVQPFQGIENCPKIGTLLMPGPPEEDLTEMMKRLNDDLFSVVIDYLKYMKNAEIKKDDW